MDSSSLSDPAALALRSLRDHPHLRTAAAIDSGPYSIQQIDADDLIDGLAELERHGLAEQPAGGWRLTATGLAAGA